VSRIDSTISTAELRRRLTDPDLTIVDVRASPAYGLPLGFPPGFAPADQEPTTHAEVGTGHRARTWNYALKITSVDSPIGSSLTACDLASHDDQQKHATPRARLLLWPREAGVRATGIGEGPLPLTRSWPNR
jgi:hypothetical protein